MKLKNNDYQVLDDIAYNMGQELRFWRVSVRDAKEKYGIVSIYCSFGITNLHDLIYPGYVYNQFPKWLRKLDEHVINPFMIKSKLTDLIVMFHMYQYTRIYLKYIKLYPKYKENILVGADHRELLEYDRMSPKLSELVERLKEYQAKDYGTEAYPLSRAEAQLLLSKLKKN